MTGGRRPQPTAPVYFFDELYGNRKKEEESAYLWESLEKFMARMRGQYEDWQEFVEYAEDRAIERKMAATGVTGP